MLKNGFVIFIIIIIMFLVSGCKGTRTVKVVVANAGVWYVEINEDSGVMTRTGYFTETYDLGNSLSNIIVDAWRVTTNANYVSDSHVAPMTVSIVEQYDNGFLYTATSDIKAQIVNTYYQPPYCTFVPVTAADSANYRSPLTGNPLAVATVTYDFTPK
jgi:hypothetical protein